VTDKKNTKRSTKTSNTSLHSNGGSCSLSNPLSGTSASRASTFSVAAVGCSILTDVGIPLSLIVTDVVKLLQLAVPSHFLAISSEVK
jgi:hypothetical protein